jgi:glyoxylase-like metal-dependent hydrolase (beta-lactamase superfamily II)
MIYRITNSLFASNTYLIKDENNHNCIIIDPGLDHENIRDTINYYDLKPIAIMCTHGHFDHIASVNYLKQQYNNIPYFIHKLDLKITKSANFFLKLTKIKYWIEYVEPDFYFEKEYEDINFNGFNLSVYNFPGHSNGSCIIKYKDFLFTGDTIYKKGLGFNNFPGENINLLKLSIKKIIVVFDNNLMVYPGHGDSEFLGKLYNDNFELLNFINS